MATPGRRGARQGAPTGTVFYSAAKLRRIRQARERQEERWASRSGPATASQLPAEALFPTRALPSGHAGYGGT
jgi:hypothetical protein